MPPRPVNPNAIQPAQRGVGKPLVAGTGAGQGMHASHRHTDEYMRSMYAALEDMGVDTADDLYRDAFDPAVLIGSVSALLPPWQMRGGGYTELLWLQQ